ncbi:hypothetical protein C2E23DRAFT_898746 [Lenzites betulinus]|nr:hypothetical protein C2E23DRAFT_898746 [Lenzites betulinus]
MPHGQVAGQSGNLGRENGGEQAWRFRWGGHGGPTWQLRARDDSPIVMSMPGRKTRASTRKAPTHAVPMGPNPTPLKTPVAAGVPHGKEPQRGNAAQAEPLASPQDQTDILGGRKRALSSTEGGRKPRAVTGKKVKGSSQVTSAIPEEIVPAQLPLKSRLRKRYLVDLSSSEDDTPLSASRTSLTTGAINVAAVQQAQNDAEHGVDSGEELSNSPGAGDLADSDEAELSESGDDLEVNNAAALEVKLSAERPLWIKRSDSSVPGKAVKSSKGGSKAKDKGKRRALTESDFLSDVEAESLGGNDDKEEDEDEDGYISGVSQEVCPVRRDPASIWASPRDDMAAGAKPNKPAGKRVLQHKAEQPVWKLPGSSSAAASLGLPASLSTRVAAPSAPTALSATAVNPNNDIDDDLPDTHHAQDDTIFPNNPAVESAVLASAVYVLVPSSTAGGNLSLNAQHIHAMMDAAHALGYTGLQQRIVTDPTFTRTLGSLTSQDTLSQTNASAPSGAPSRSLPMHM